MRSTEDARSRWEATFTNVLDISALREAVHKNGEDNPCERGLRSVCWKAFLIFENLDRSTWRKTIYDSRSAYASLREHFLSTAVNPGGTANVDPLADVEGSPWNTLREDELLRAEILQDVERCMPEHNFFREPSTQCALLDILFIFCKLNADIGYRQGMHELLAPIYWIVWQDGLDCSGPDKNNLNEQLKDVLDSKFIEHDAFTLFCIVMQTAKSFYETTAMQSAPSAGTSSDSPILVRSKRVYNNYLQRTDPELLEHLVAIDVLPQIFVLRWIRLLFGREFPFENVLSLWDVLFAEDPTFELVDLVCVAMLLRIRWQLLEADYTSVLTILLRYPLPPSEHPPKTFVEDAIYLQSHLSPVAGSHLIRKYTGKPPRASDITQHRRPRRSMHTPKTSTDQTYGLPMRSPSRYIQDSGGIEAIIQGAAKGVYQRSEKLGLSQALRGAVQQLQAVNSSPRRYLSLPRPSLDSGDESTSQLNASDRQLESLEARNKSLAKMVQDSINDLSEQAHSLEEAKAEAAANRLALTIAKLQFVHVYLDNTGLPLGDEVPNQAKAATDRKPLNLEPSSVVEDVETISWSPVQPENRGRLPTAATHELPPPPPARIVPTITESPTRKYVSPRRQPASTLEAAAGKGPAVTSKPTMPLGSPFQRSRPALAQSSFSWMLGAEAEAEKSEFAAASPFPPERERSRAELDRKARGKAGFLFGEEAHANSAGERGELSHNRAGIEDDDGFTLGTLRGVEKH